MFFIFQVVVWPHFVISCLLWMNKVLFALNGSWWSSTKWKHSRNVNPWKTLETKKRLKSKTSSSVSEFKRIESVAQSCKVLTHFMMISEKIDPLGEMTWIVVCIDDEGLFSLHKIAEGNYLFQGHILVITVALSISLQQQFFPTTKRSSRNVANVFRLKESIFVEMMMKDGHK